MSRISWFASKRFSFIKKTYLIDPIRLSIDILELTRHESFRGASVLDPSKMVRKILHHAKSLHHQLLVQTMVSASEFLEIVSRLLNN